MNDKNDRELVRRCIAGEEAAWETFFPRVTAAAQKTIRYTLRAFGFRPQESVVEEISLAVIESLFHDRCRSLRQYRGDVPLEPWLTRIARRQTAQFLRERRLPRSGPVAPDPKAPETADPADRAGRAEEARNVREAFSRLPEQDRFLLEEIYLNETSYQKAASRLGIPFGTLASRVARAKERFCDLLDRLRLLLL